MHGPRINILTFGFVTWFTIIAVSLNTASGYAQFPGYNSAHDGVVINYDSFGTIGYRIPGRHLGRTATHEVAHWLNLKHIWGHNSNCTDDDEVVDTPRQKGSNSGCAYISLYCSKLPGYRYEWSYVHELFRLHR